MKTNRIINTLEKANTFKEFWIWKMPSEYENAITEAPWRLKILSEQIQSMIQTNQALAKKLKEEDEILNSACEELRFANLQKAHYRNLLDEVEVLLNKWVKHNLIKAVIENWRARADIDICINYDIK